MLVLRGAPPAQGGIQELGALVGHVSVIMQRQFQQFSSSSCRSRYAQCTLCSRPWRSHKYGCEFSKTQYSFEVLGKAFSSGESANGPKKGEHTNGQTQEQIAFKIWKNIEKWLHLGNISNILANFAIFWKKSRKGIAIVNENCEITECKGVHSVDLGESFLTLAKFGFDTAKNERSKVCPLSAYRSTRSLLLLIQITQASHF